MSLKKLRTSQCERRHLLGETKENMNTLGKTAAVPVTILTTSQKVHCFCRVVRWSLLRNGAVPPGVKHRRIGTNTCSFVQKEETGAGRHMFPPHCSLYLPEGKAIPVHTMKAHRWAKVLTGSFLTSALVIWVVSFPTRPSYPGTHWAGSLVGPRADLDLLEKRKEFCLPGSSSP